MQINLPALLLLACLVSSATAEMASPKPGDPEAVFTTQDVRKGIADIVSDGEGRIWAYLTRWGAELQVLEKGRWRSVRPQGFAKPDRVEPKALTRLKDGSIACLWQDRSAKKLFHVTWHAAKEDVPPVTLAVDLSRPILLPLEDGGLLITHEGREVLRLRKGRADSQTTLLPESLWVPPEARSDGSSSSGHAKVHAVEHAGALWLWNPALREPVHLWRLRGLVKMTGTALNQVDLKMPDKYRAISVVTPRDGKLTIAVAGLLVMDYVEGLAKQTGFSGHEDLNYIEQFFKAGGTWNMVGTPKPDLVEFTPSTGINSQVMVNTKRYFDPEERGTVLVAMSTAEQNNLKMHRRTPKLDTEPLFGWWDRPVLETEEGFWCGSQDGALFFPSDSKKKPLVMGARQVVGLQKADAKNMLVLFQNGEAVLKPLKPEKEETEGKPAIARIERMKTGSYLVDDGAGSVMGRSPNGLFCRWDQEGNRQPLEVPESVLAMRTHMLAADGTGQAWLWPKQDGPAAVLDLPSGQWEVFPDPKKALEARLRAGSKLLLHDWPGYAPFAAVSRPKQIAFMRMDGTLHFFDGGQWQSWQPPQIGGEGARATGAPFFDSSGLLTIPLEFTDHQLIDGKRWQEAGVSDIENNTINNTRSPTPPEGCPVEPHRVTCTAYDRHGVCWMRDYDMRLWKCFHGAAAIFMEHGSKDDPLHGDSCKIYEAHVTDSGHAFLRIALSADDEQDYLHVRPRHPVPVSEAKLDQVSGDTAKLRLGKAEWHVWRVDGGKWSAATKEREAVVTGLEPGGHEIEVLALNAEITPAIKTAKLTCHITESSSKGSKKVSLR
ncbi:MAG: hypothetical protein IPK22_18010 [Verrucomicrobiaceae bacterium]|nr:hypothetical protein [Verrucomicrobiaceae bacterium]